MMTINYTTATKAAIDEMHAAVKLCEEKRVAGLAYAGKDEQLDIAKKAVNKANDAIVTDAVQAFVAMAEQDKEAMMREYFKDWYVSGFKVTQDSAEDGGAVRVDDKALRVPFSAIDTASKAVKLTTNGAWKKYITIFIDNCMGYWATQEKGESAAVTKEPLTQELLEKRAAMGEKWGTKDKGNFSKNALCEQLNDIEAMIVPESMLVHMLKADVRAILTAVMNYKREDVMGGLNFRTSKSATVEEIIFKSIYGRMNNVAMEITNGQKQKPAQDAKGNEELNEKPAKGGVVKAVKVAEKEAA